MTGTVIDSLVVELGLDPRKFTEGQREALAAFKRTQEEAEKGAKDTEERSRRVGLSISDLRRTALDMFAVFTGGKGVVEFVGGIIRADASVGRLSRSVGESVGTITKWQAVARLFGGSAEGMAASFTTVSDAFAGWKVGIVSPLIADFRAISTAGGKIIDVNKGVDQSFLDLADNMKAIYDKDPARAGMLGRRIGLDPAMIDILIQGSAKTKEFLDYVKQIGVATEKATKDAQSLERQWAEMSLKSESATRSLLGGWFGNVIKGMNAGAASDMEALGNFGNDPWGSLASILEYGKAAESKMPKPSYGDAGGGASFATKSEKEAYIREEARKRGIDPNIAMAVAKSEGFDNYVGDKGTSFGAFQLHYKNNIPGLSNAGLGDEFTKKTGKHASDPATEREQIQFALDQAKQSGWGPWHGWKGSRWAGIGQGGGNSTSTEINIDKIEVNAGPNADGTKIGQDVRAELQRRQSAAAQANDGQN